jgi:hypothetical protein
MPTLAQHRRALAQHRRKVEENESRWRASIRARNDAVRAAKADGMSAQEAYAEAGVSQSAYSRTSRRGGAAGQ